MPKPTKKTQPTWLANGKKPARFRMDEKVHAAAKSGSTVDQIAKTTKLGRRKINASLRWQAATGHVTKK
jgi:hypothetical protein